MIVTPPGRDPDAIKIAATIEELIDRPPEAAPVAAARKS